MVTLLNQGLNIPELELILFKIPLKIHFNLTSNNTLSQDSIGVSVGLFFSSFLPMNKLAFYLNALSL